MTVRACPLTAPVAQAITLRARCASAWAVFGRWAHRPRASALLAGHHQGRCRSSGPIRHFLIACDKSRLY